VLAGAAVWPLLAYLGAAAQGDGHRELLDAVGLDAKEAATAASELIAELEKSRGVRTAIAVWCAGDVELTDWWRETVPADSHGELNADPMASQAEIDSWVRNRTAGLIAGLPRSVTSETKVLLLGALTIRARWEQPFRDTSLTPGTGPWADREIAGLYRESPDVDQLSVFATPVGPLALLSVDAYDDIVVELALAQEGCRTDEVLVAALQAVSGEQPRKLGSQLSEDDDAPGVTVSVEESFEEEPRLDATVPRFSVDASHDLRARGDVFGLRTVTRLRTAADELDERGHFPKLSTYPLARDTARQEITASFTEMGFEAAAVTSFGMVLWGIPDEKAKHISVRFERPFAFIARLRSSGLVLLVGWVGDAHGA
jgi:serine protease inhibitor